MFVTCTWRWTGLIIQDLLYNLIVALYLTFLFFSHKLINNNIWNTDQHSSKKKELLKRVEILIYAALRFFYKAKIQYVAVFYIMFSYIR